MGRDVGRVSCELRTGDLGLVCPVEKGRKDFPQAFHKHSGGCLS